MVVIWGVNFAVVKWALEAFEPLGFNALRFAVASLFVLAVLRARGTLRLPARQDVPRIVLLGLVGNVLYQMAFILGLNRTQAGNASLMLALSPVFTTLLSARVGHERPGIVAWLGAGVSVAGVALVSGSTLSVAGAGHTLLGDAILVGAAGVWAFYTVGSRELVRRYGSVQATAWTLWVGAAGLMVLGLPSLARQEWSRVDAAAWGGLLFSAVFAIGLAYLIWYRGVERIGNTRTAIFSNLVPFVALTTGALWLGERFTPGAILGAGLTIAGVLLVRADPRRA